LKISHVNTDELNKFCIIPGRKPLNIESVKKLWKDGISKPELCFIAESDGEIKGRIGFRIAESEKQLNIFGLLLPELDDVSSEISKIFFESILQIMRDKGIHTIGYYLNSSKENHLKELKLLESCGMEIIQTKKNFILKNEDYQPKTENRLIYKTLSEIGKENFLKAFEEVTEKTLDREDEWIYNKLGSQIAAEDHFNLLENLGDPDDTWYLAYRNETFIGLIIPQKFNDKFGAINYIGVIPSQRGNNYVSDLLDKGVNNLVERNVQEIIADIDDRNFPMENSLTKIGFREEKKIWVLKFIL